MKLSKLEEQLLSKNIQALNSINTNKPLDTIKDRAKNHILLLRKWLNGNEMTQIKLK